MLIQLSVENIAIIEKLTIEFEDGFNILTGETGAGKSILIDAINALLGNRVSRDIIRLGEDKAKVEAVFEVPGRLINVLNDMGIEPSDDETLVISRQFSASGKNICRVNGALVTVAQLKEIGEYLIDIHGQHDNQSLLRNQAQIAYLDMFSGRALLNEKELYQKLLKRYNDVDRKISELRKMEKERARLEDLYRYQAKEISAACLKKGEDIELERKSSILSNAEGIMQAFSSAYLNLAGDENIVPGALDMVQQAQTAIEGIAGIDAEFDGISSNLLEVADRLAELTREIRIKKESINYDPQQQQEIEERLALIGTLKRKYGNTIEEIIEYGNLVQQKLEEVSDTENLLNKLTAEKSSLENELYAKACRIHDMRVKAAGELKEKVTNELKDLEMEKAEFMVGLQFDQSRNYSENGLDSIEFLISPNPGEGFKPLSRIASGGEMSRIMLAIKTILADVDEIGVLIFDEIDTGVGGKAALKVGEKLLQVSAKHQVICITHHAQIASLAKAHYLISKKTDKSRTIAILNKLDGSEREKEIARLLSGEENKSTTTLAKEMIEKGKTLRTGTHQSQ
ncbi:MAG TPA: DNA repair protein RecN [Clostridia bacterium]